MKKIFTLIAAAVMSVSAANAQIAEGNYYIQNVESGAFLSGANSWGTQASATVNGEQFNVAAVNGGYTITGVLLSSANKTLGYNLFVDTNRSQNGDVWTIAPVEGEEGVYTIYGKGKRDNVEDAYEGYIAQGTVAGNIIGFPCVGVSEVTDAAKWRFLTKEQAIANIKAGDNVTFLFDNANFTRNHATSAWIVDEGCTNKNLAGGDNNNFCAESWHSTFNISQTVAGLPNGTYSMTVQAFYRQDGSDNDNLPVIYANGKEVLFPFCTGSESSMKEASGSFNQGLYTIDPIEFEVVDGTVTLGVKNEANAALWCIWDNFQIVCKVNKAALAAKIAEAQALENEALAEAIAAALDALDVPGATQADIDAALEALTEAISKATSIKSVSVAKANIAKVVENGQVVIVKNGQKFNVAGQAK